ncbi:hypothetical protein JMUB7549_27680 [Staphylococcus aureus]
MKVLSPFFKQKTAYEMSASLVGSEMCIRDSRLFASPQCYFFQAEDGIRDER